MGTDIKNKNKNKPISTPSQARRGFSLVELMVVLAIIAIMTGVLLAFQSGNRAQEDVEAAARQVAAQLRSLQNEAINGKIVDDGTGTMVPVCRFRFQAAAGSTSYTVSYRNCSGNLIGSNSQSADFDSRGSVESQNATGNLYFRTPRGESYVGGTALQDLSPNYVRIILREGSGPSVKRATVCVCGSGNIYEDRELVDCAC